MFDIVRIPERSCQWHRSGSLSSDTARLWHPFVILRLKFGVVAGLGCTSNSVIYDEEKISLPLYDPGKVSWVKSFDPRPTYVVARCWHIAWGHLLFEGESKPRKIASILDPDLQGRMRSAITGTGEAAKP